LNIVEIELRVLTVQCLNRRIGDAATLRREVHAWETQQNASDARVDWQFTSEDARIHLKQLYHVFKRDTTLASWIGSAPMSRGKCEETCSAVEAFRGVSGMYGNALRDTYKND
jgi:hypothetical protein